MPVYTSLSSLVVIHGLVMRDVFWHHDSFDTFPVLCVESQNCIMACQIGRLHKIQEGPTLKGALAFNSPQQTRTAFCIFVLPRIDHRSTENAYRRTNPPMRGARVHDYNYLLNCLPLDKEHEEWIQAKIDDTAIVTDVSTIAIGSETLHSTVDENDIAATEQDAEAHPITHGLGTVLVSLPVLPHPFPN
jgi:hypothetical protein